MSALESSIDALADEHAIALVNRFIRAQRSGPGMRQSNTAAAASIGQALSLTAEAVAPPSAGEAARLVLRLLANDPRYRDGIEALVTAPRSHVFSNVAAVLEPADVLCLLQTEFFGLPDVQDKAMPASEPAEVPGVLRSVARQLLAYAGFGQTGPQADAEYQVWYATTRRPLNSADPSMGYGVDRDDRVHYGSCTVFIPKSHKVGSIGSGWLTRTITMTDDRLRVMSCDAMEEHAFWDSVAERLKSRPVGEQDAVVFIHGFNVDFNEAAIRAAQLGFDLQVKGPMAFFSWASRGDVSKYPADEASIELDEGLIAEYLCNFARKSGARRVHVIAHSMGNRAVLRAAERIVQDAQLREGVQFGQFILAAPDVDARFFKQRCAAYEALSQRTTLYVSSRDLAVESSKWLHDFPRAGLLPPVTVVSDIDTVNVVNADITLLGHGYVAEAREVIADIHSLIWNDLPPEKRFGLQPTATESGQRYWLIGA